MCVVFWKRIIAFVGLVHLAPIIYAADADPTAERVKFFESRIRPTLVEHCYQCHSRTSKEIQGSLVLDSREGVRRGGDSGPAIMPGSPDKSLLIKAIRYKDPDLQMPPKEAGGKLPDRVIADFEAWVKMGAPDPRTQAVTGTANSNANKAKDWWSFQPLKTISVPQPKNAAWVADELDRFVLAKHDEKKLKPVEDADPRTLLRRLCFDLTGLPPSRKEIAAFVTAWSTSKNHQALIASTVDRLLDSPQFGERWARHWLDVARYAESCGKDVNVVYTNAWRYRDYVIQAFNGDTPFDRFLQEQVAGDLLPAKSDADRARNLIATGFLAVGPKSLNEMRAKQFAVDLADEQIESTTEAFLGLTVACARCHDHKFDPISQRDYSELAGIFLSTDTKFGTAGGVVGRNQSTLIELPAAAGQPIAAQAIPPPQRRRKQERLEDLQKQQRAAIAARFGGKAPAEGTNVVQLPRLMTQAAQLEAELAAHNADGSPKTLAMGVAEKPVTASPLRRYGLPVRPNGPGGKLLISGFEQIGDSPLFTRGNIDTPTSKVPRGIPAIVAPHANPVPATSSGRLELARGLASADNPLTSRVIVNRVWLWLFGRGLVESVDNFGASGTPPSNPELLDYLAQRFVHEGWSIKRLVREIALSHTYRLASTHDDADFTADPENKWLWRHSPRRLEAEEIRDAMLAAAGRLELRPPVGSVIGRAGDGQIGGGPLMALNEQQIIQADNDARSLYLPIPRNVQPNILATFDMPDAASVQGAREATNVPSQALFLLNSDFVARQSSLLGAGLVNQFPGQYASDRFRERLSAAYRLCLARPPRETEFAAARKLIERHNNSPATAWTNLAQGLFASAEFRLLD